MPRQTVIRLSSGSGEESLRNSMRAGKGLVGLGAMCPAGGRHVLGVVECTPARVQVHGRGHGSCYKGRAGAPRGDAAGQARHPQAHEGKDGPRCGG